MAIAGERRRAEVGLAGERRRAEVGNAGERRRAEGGIAGERRRAEVGIAETTWGQRFEQKTIENNLSIKMRTRKVSTVGRFGWQSIFAARTSSEGAKKRTLLFGAERRKFHTFLSGKALFHKLCALFIAQRSGDPTVPGPTIFGVKL